MSLKKTIKGNRSKRSICNRARNKKLAFKRKRARHKKTIRAGMRAR